MRARRRADDHCAHVLIGERLSEIDVDEIARAASAEGERARRWIDDVGRWLREQGDATGNAPFNGSTNWGDSVLELAIARELAETVRDIVHPQARLVFDSSKIPGEIEDLLVINTETLKDNPNLGKALVGIWYETIALMKDESDKGKAAREAMAKLSGTDLAGFETQLKTTYMYYTPKDGAAFMTGAELPKIMDQVRGFCFEHNLLGEKVKSKDAIGIMTPTKTLGSSKNVKLRFDASYMTLAAEGKL